MTVLFACLAAAAAWGQAPKKAPDTPAEEKREFKILPVQHRSAFDLIKLFQLLYKGDVGRGLEIVPDAPNARVYVRGRTADIELLEGFLQKADTPVPAQAPTAVEEPVSPVVKVFPFKHLLPGKNVEEVTKLLIADSTASFVVDVERKLLVVRADQPILQAIDTVLHKIDVPAPRVDQTEVRLRIVWLVVGQGADQHPEPPEDLLPALVELDKIGFKNPHMAAQTVVRALVSTQFQALGQVRLDEDYTLKIEGKATKLRFDGPSEKSQDLFKLALSLDASLQARNPARGGQVPDQPPVPLYLLQTQITTPPNHLVVLGMTPTKALTSAFIVQVIP
jgi:hypothetical protein